MFAVVILGAGLGTRFGGPKAVARTADGRTFLERIVESATASGAAVVVAVVPPGVTPPSPARRVVNAAGAGEQIMSLRLGLAVLANTGVHGALVWPVDFPFVTAETARSVAEAGAAAGAGTGTAAEIAVPVHDGRRGHPVYFARAVWRELLTVGEGGARSVVARVPGRVRPVPVADAAVLRDIDTLEDLHASEEATRNAVH